MWFVGVPCGDLDMVYVTSTLLEVANKVPPPVFSKGDAMNFALAFDDNLKTYWRGSNVSWEEPGMPASSTLR